jgi:hypothetical protein
MSGSPYAGNGTIPLGFLPDGTPTRTSLMVSADANGLLYTFAMLIALFQISDLPQDGATTGQVLQWNGTTWMPGTVSGTTLAAANVAAAGTNQATATQLTLARNYVLTGTGGVKLPPASTFANNVISVRNATGAGITLYPYPGDKIEANATNAGIPLANGATANCGVDATGIVRIN